MAISRQMNWTSQIRADVPFFRSIESSICNDFDVLAGTSLAGQSPQVISGLHMVTTGITLATSLILQVADSVLIHFLATASGSLFHIDAAESDQVLNNTNPKIIGGWTVSSTNYVSLDIIRAPNAATSDLVEIVDTVSLLEQPVTQPLGITTDYRVIISPSDFDQSGGCPIAKVTLDAGGAIVSIQDARNFMFRLGSGGTIPNVLNSYSWPGGRNEAGSLDPFAGADKSIQSFKALNDALETRLWELGGGEHWYSPTADRNCRLATTGSPFVSNGMYLEFTGGHVHWKGLVFVFDNSTASFNVINDQTSNVAGLTDLTSGTCLYVDLDRSVNRTGGTALNAQKGTLATLGTPTIPGSRWVLAWNYNGSIFIRDQTFAVGSSFILATVSAAGTVELSATDDGAASPTRVATVNSVSKLAAAAGISRGHGDFFGGSGDLTIGGDTLDLNVLIKSDTETTETRIQGLADFDSFAAAALSVAGVGSTSLGHKVIIRSGTQSIDTDPTSRLSNFHVYGDGAIGFANISDGAPGNLVAVTPAPTATAPVRSKMFCRNNGLTTPNKRDQMCMMQSDGGYTVVWESDPY